MRIALYRPEIAGNVGAILRLAACLRVSVDIIEPTGFLWNDARLRRAGMDYIDRVKFVRHAGWEAFRSASGGRLLLLTTRGDVSPYDFAFERHDVLLFGSESAGVPGEVAIACTARLRIPIAPDVRSLNLAVACGIATAEALRRTGQLPA